MMHWAITVGTTSCALPCWRQSRSEGLPGRVLFACRIGQSLQAALGVVRSSGRSGLNGGIDCHLSVIHSLSEPSRAPCDRPATMRTPGGRALKTAAAFHLIPTVRAMWTDSYTQKKYAWPRPADRSDCPAIPQRTCISVPVFYGNESLFMLKTV